MNRSILFITLLASSSPIASAQDDLLDLLGPDSMREYAAASFKTSRVINSHSLENCAAGVLDFKIGHRFGEVSDGAEQFFGLDKATIRLGLDYGLTDRIMIGIGRSSYQKTVDGFVKYKILKQCAQGCGMPFTVALVAASSITTLLADQVPWYSPDRTDYFTHRLSYSYQLIIGRKFTESFSFQFMPGVVHRNLVRYAEEQNDVVNVGAAGRIKLTKRIAFNAEYFYVLPDQLHQPTAAELEVDPKAGFKNALSLGFDIETGGHVFQLHFTNATGMFERAFITENTNSWEDQQIHYGFNISRVFTLHTPKHQNLDDWF